MAVQESLAESALQADALAPGLGRVRVKSDVVAAQAIAHQQTHIGPLHRRLLQPVVDPAHLTLQDAQFGLAQQPICESRRLARTKIDTGHTPSAVGIAPHFQHRAIQLDALQRQLQQGGGRQTGPQLGQVQHLVALGIAQHEIRDLERRHQTIGDRAELTDADLHAPGLGSGVFDFGPPVDDSRHNQKMQSETGQQQQRPKSQHQTQDHFGQPDIPAQTGGQGVGQ